MSQILTFELGGDGLPIRLDLFIRHEISGLSRTEVQRLIRTGNASINGHVVYTPSTKLKCGDYLEFDIPGAPPADAPPVKQHLKFDVVYEDEHLLVVDKPAGLAVHAGAGRSDGNLVNGLIARYPEIADLEPNNRPGIVHRLDADTSGLMVVARTAVAVKALSTAIKARDVDRRYTAMVVAKHRKSSSHGIIDRPIGRHPTIRTKMAIIKTGKSARTRYVRSAGYSAFGHELQRVDLKLETGRTHQIRVHMQSIGLPILGDPTYGTVIPELPLRRQFLHANRLGFVHPISEIPMAFDSNLPRDLQGVMRIIGQPHTVGYYWQG